MNLSKVLFRRKASTFIAYSALLLCVGCAQSESSATHADSNASTGVTYLPSESQQLIVECLTNNGWDVEVNETNHSIETSVFGEEYERFEEEYVDCEAQYPVDLRPVSTWSDEEQTKLYSAEMVTVDCLREKGYTVPQVPSQTEYIDRYATINAWVAYSYLGDMEEDEWSKINNQCPQPADQPNMPWNS